MKRNIRPGDGFPLIGNLFAHTIIVLVLLLVLSGGGPAGCVRAESDKITWEEYDGGMSLSTRNNRTVLIYFFEDNSQCVKMDTNTWKNSDVIGAVQGMICIKVVRENDNRHIIDEYRIDHYPTVVFLDKDGEEEKRVVGYRSSDDFLDDLASLEAEEKPAISGFLTIFIPVIIATLLLIIVLYAYHVRKKGGK